MKKLSKTEAIEFIKNFFKDIKNKDTKEIKEIKNLAMSHNIPLKDKRKLFCKKCLMPYTGKEKVRIKNKFKTIICNNCKAISRWKLR